MQELGNAIRKMRKQKNITLEYLAQKTELSASFISKIERGINSPSFNNLQKICQALGVSSTELIAPEAVTEISDAVIRKSDRRLIYDYSNVVRFESVFSYSPHFSVDVMTLRGSRNEYSSTQHPHDEFGIVARGVLSVKMNGEEYILNEGDCVLIKAGVIHCVQKCSEEDCISYWVMAKRDQPISD